MRKTWKVAILTAALLAGAATTASADSRVRLSVGIGVPAPVYYPAPQVVYMPPPQVVYSPPVVYRAPVIVYDSYPRWRHRHHRHHHHWR